MIVGFKALFTIIKKRLILKKIMDGDARKQVWMLHMGSGKWPCVKTCNCFVLGQAAQECLLCTPVCLQYMYFGVGNGGLGISLRYS